MLSRARQLAVGLLAAGLSFAGPLTTRAQAATYDPELTWRTLSTPHFDIHFHQGVEQVADELARAAERILETMTEELQWRPRGRVQVVLVDRTDAANGYASVVPYDQIVIYVTAPTADSTLNFYEDWTEAIFTHELTHVLHMDANHGIVRLARAVIGKAASTNELSPRWMVEGLATFQETRHTAGGRGRGAWADMIKRTTVLEGDFPPLGNLDGLQPDPPAGNLRYLFGQDFMQFVADRTGEDVWTRWVHTYGSGLPFLLPSKRVFGRRLAPLYREWRAHTEARYAAQAEAVRAEGETVGRLVSDGEASCVAPAFSPDGEKLVWSCYDLRKGSAIWMADGDGGNARVLLRDRGASRFTWRADSRAFVYAASHVVNQFNVWSDVYMHTLDGGTVPLTQGRRARDPDFSVDGSRLLYVTNRAQHNQLEVATVDRRTRTLTDHRDHTQIAAPRHAPDGQHVALSLWRDGRRDLWLYTVEGEPVRRLTSDAAIDTDPAWSPDGRWLFFASDRSGIYQIYAIDTTTERLWQVTRVVTGAVHPSVHPNGTRLAYQQYSADGWDVRMLDLDPSDWIDRGLLPRPVRHATPLAAVLGPPVDRVAVDWSGAVEPARRGLRGAPFDPVTGRVGQSPDETVDTFEDAHVRDVFGEEQDYPFHIEPRRYNPLPTLRPRYVLPYLQTTPQRPGPTFARLGVPWGLLGTLSTGSSDALRHVAWSASAHYRTDIEQGGGSFGLTYNRFVPVFQVGASTRAVASSRLFFFDPTAPVAEGEQPPLSTFADRSDPAGLYWERRSTAWAQVSWPYKLRTTVFARYSLTDRRTIGELPPFVYEPLVPLRGTLGALSAGWRYNWSQQTAYAISREDGRIFSFVGSLLHPWLGTRVLGADGARRPLTQVQLASEIREYVVNPLIPNHVLAMRAAAGLSLGGTEYLGNYQLGGSFGDSAFYATPEEFRMLRGYPFASDFGDMYWLAGAEYRFPIWRVHRGLGTLPAYLRDVSGAVFVDAGNAFNSPAPNVGELTANALAAAAVADPLVGFGAELTVSTFLLWGLGIDGRLGYAAGLGERGFRLGDPRAWYFHLGGSF